jgi:RNA polymerase sigma-70 factor, ECF subfamily
VGIVVAPRRRLRIVISCTVKGGKIAEMDVIADPARLRELNLAVSRD